MTARWRADRGAVLVELAVVTTVVVTALLAVFELSLAWRDTQVVADAAATGARAAGLHPGRGVAGATSSSAPQGSTVSTAVVAATIRDALAGVDPSRLEQVAVFGPSGSTGTPTLDRLPTGCRQGLESPGCVLIPPAVVTTARVAECRDCGLVVIHGGGDSVGVYVRVRGSSPLWGARPVEAAAEVRVEGGGGGR